MKNLVEKNMTDLVNAAKRIESEAYRKALNDIEMAMDKRAYDIESLLYNDEAMNILSLSYGERFDKLSKRRGILRRKCQTYYEAAGLCNTMYRKTFE